uniref:Anti-sigma factor antagonist n=1 Tax=Fundidesulfovibrio putealis TaxID=270496 RepID=A0A7C4AI49_9BACT
MTDDRQSPWTASGDPASGEVKITGEVDFTNSQAVRDWLKDFARTCPGEVLLDLSELQYIDSSGLAVLIEVRKAMLAGKRSLRITAATTQVHKLFDLTQIGELFGL